ncbi:hypothetical protein [Streptomyces sp. NPDC092370]|uniref:hypothetical protein n=1 Tax=Streptomyces sp. NPDC092370 TaxID=3366016 RepID=UPI00381325AF
MTTNTPARPRGDIGSTTAPHRREPPGPLGPAPAETGPFAPRVRGRHRKPRPRKVLLAVGGLALATGALSLLRLASGPDADAGPVTAGPRPDPVSTAPDDTTHTAAAFPAAPEASPSSPTPLGDLPPSPATGGPQQPPSTTAGTSAGAPATGPAPTTIPDTPNTPDPAPTASQGDAPRPAPAPSARPSRTAPTPAPRPEAPAKPQDPGLCVPVIGLCVDSPLGHR